MSSSVQTSSVDVRPWNLGVSLALLSACGRTLPLLPGGESDTEASTSHDTSDPTGDPTTAGECTQSEDCPPGYYCYQNECIGYSSDDDYCSTGGCCYDGCCYDGCNYYQCYEDFDCGDGYECQNHYCVQKTGPEECTDWEIGFIDPQALHAYRGEVSLAFVDTPSEAGSVLVVGDATGLQLVNPVSTTVLADLPTTSLDVGDLDADGDEDLVVGAADGLHAFVWDLDNGFVAGAVTMLPDGQVPVRIDLADFDGDAHADAFATTSDATMFLRGMGDGTFDIPVAVSGPSCDLLGILNGPVVEDVLYGFDGSVYVIPGNPDLQFDFYGPLTSGLGPTCVLAGGDFDGDGIADGAVLDPATGQITYWTAPSNLPSSYLWQPNLPDPAIAVDDLDLDGDDDVVVAGGADQLVVRFGHTPDLQGGDPLGCTANLPLGFTPSKVVLGDLDGSGHVDLVGADGSTVWVAFSLQ